MTTTYTDDVLNEDWLRGNTWDIRLPDGRLARTLDEVARALGSTDIQQVAADLLRLPSGKAAPDDLKVEAVTFLAELGTMATVKEQAKTDHPETEVKRGKLGAIAGDIRKAKPDGGISIGGWWGSRGFSEALVVRSAEGRFVDRLGYGGTPDVGSLGRVGGAEAPKTPTTPNVPEAPNAPTVRAPEIPNVPTAPNVPGPASPAAVRAPGRQRRAGVRQANARQRMEQADTLDAMVDALDLPEPLQDPAANYADAVRNAGDVTRREVAQELMDAIEAHPEGSEALAALINPADVVTPETPKAKPGRQLSGSWNHWDMYEPGTAQGPIPPDVMQERIDAVQTREELNALQKVLISEWGAREGSRDERDQIMNAVNTKWRSLPEAAGAAEAARAEKEGFKARRAAREAAANEPEKPKVPDWSGGWALRGPDGGPAQVGEPLNMGGKEWRWLRGPRGKMRLYSEDGNWGAERKAPPATEAEAPPSAPSGNRPNVVINEVAQGPITGPGGEVPSMAPAPATPAAPQGQVSKRQVGELNDLLVASGRADFDPNLLHRLSAANAQEWISTLRNDRNAQGPIPANPTQAPTEGTDVNFPAAPPQPGVAQGPIKDIPHVDGRTAPPATGELDDPIDVQGDLQAAIKHLSEGKHVRLNQPDEVSSMLDILAVMVDDAVAKTDKGDLKALKEINLCNVTVPGTNLFCTESKGIPRTQMPQLSGVPLPDTPAAEKLAANPNKKGEIDMTPEFLAALAASGIGVEEKTVLASHLRASQNELAGDKVAGMTRAMRAGKVPEGAIFVTRDGYIIDGHHRWASKVAIDVVDGVTGDISMPVQVLDMDIGEALDYANAFSKRAGIPQASMKNNPNAAAMPTAPTPEAPAPVEDVSTAHRFTTVTGALMQGKGEVYTKLTTDAKNAGKALDPAQQKALTRWTGERGGVRAFQNRTVPPAQQEAFDEALQAMPAVDNSTFVYRGVAGSAADFQTSLTEGQTLHLGEMVSTSVDPRQAMAFSPNIYEIENSQAAYVAPLSHHAYEKEAVLAPGDFTVVSIEETTVRVGGKDSPAFIVRLKATGSGTRSFQSDGTGDFTAVPPAVEDHGRFVQDPADPIGRFDPATPTGKAPAEMTDEELAAAVSALQTSLRTSSSGSGRLSMLTAEQDRRSGPAGPKGVTAQADIEEMMADQVDLVSGVITTPTDFDPLTADLSKPENYAKGRDAWAAAAAARDFDREAVLREALVKAAKPNGIDFTKTPAGMRPEQPPVPWGSGYAPGHPRNNPAYDKYCSDLEVQIDKVIAEMGDTKTLHDKQKLPNTVTEGLTELEIDTLRYKPTRRDAHRRIVDAVMAKYADVPKDHQAIIMAGPPGSGKSTVIKMEGTTFGVDEGAKNFATINPDDMKDEIIKAGLLPTEYQSEYGLGALESAAMLHGESAHLKNLLQARLYADGYNVILDGTFGDADSSKESAKIAKLKSLNYEVTGVLIDGTMDMSYRNAGNRHMAPPEEVGGPFTGRYVPNHVLAQQAVPTERAGVSPLTDKDYRTMSSLNFENAHTLFDGGAIWYNNDSFTPNVFYTTAIERLTEKLKDPTLSPAAREFNAKKLTKLENALKQGLIRENATKSERAEETKAGRPLPGPSQPSANPGATKLREYWVHGEGAAKIRWGQPHDFDRCVTHMRKYVGVRAEGLCNVYHRSALGVAPGMEHGGKGKHKADAPPSETTDQPKGNNTNTDPEWADSIMVALYPDDDTAKALAVKGGLTATDLHVTLAYLGKVGDYQPVDLDDLTALVGEIATGLDPLSGTVNGVGRFNADGDDKGDPVYANVDVVGLDALRARVAGALEADGFAVSTKHGFTPHMTLTYVDGDDAPLPTVQERGLSFDFLSVSIGPDVYDFPLASQPPLEEAPQEAATDTAPEGGGEDIAADQATPQTQRS